MNIAETLAEAIAKSGIDRLEAQWLLLHVLGREPHERAWLLAHDQDPLASEVQDRLLQLCARRAAGEPLAYLVGRRGFYGLLLGTDARALDPRPDTETLVDWAIETLAPLERPRAADLGTGSGAIALALKHHRPDAQVVAMDASTDALALARENAAALGLEVSFVRSDWFDPEPSYVPDGGFDLIVSNPPYIAEADPHLAALTHEPRAALVAGPDGLADLRQIVVSARAHLRPRGWLLLEHGHDQAPTVRALLRHAGFERVGSRRDLAGIERCSGGRGQ